MSERFRLFSAGAFALAATVLAGSAAAQDYDAGKNGPQLFASDCSTCHSSPHGLAKGKDSRSLTNFLAEHYTSKRESAQLLAAYLLGAGPGDARQDKAGVPAEPKAKTKTRRSEREEERKGEARPEPKPRAELKPRAEPARRAEAQPAEAREEAPKRTRDREPAKGADATLSKLRYYGSARGETKDTARLASPQQRLQSYANSGSSSMAPASDAHNDAAPAAGNHKMLHRKKKKDTDTAASTPTGQPKPVPQQHPAGSN